MSAPRLDAANIAGITSLMNQQNIKQGIDLEKIEKDIMGKKEDKTSRHSENDPVKLYTQELNQLADELGIELLDDDVKLTKTGPIGSDNISNMIKPIYMGTEKYHSKTSNKTSNKSRNKSSNKYRNKSKGSVSGSSVSRSSLSGSSLSGSSGSGSSGSGSSYSGSSYSGSSESGSSESGSSYSGSSDSGSSYSGSSYSGSSYSGSSYSGSSRSGSGSGSSRSDSTDDENYKKSKKHGKHGNHGKHGKHGNHSNMLSVIPEERKHINYVVGNIRNETETAIGEEKERLRDNKASKLEQIGQLRMALEDEGIDCTSVTKPSMDSSIDEIDGVLNILRLKNDRNRYSTLAEEIILGVAEGIETVFNGTRRIPILGWRPDYTGYHNTVNVKLHRMRFETSQVVGSIIEKRKISPTARIALELLPSFLLYPRQQKIQKESSKSLYDGYSSNKITDARSAYNSIRTADEKKSLYDALEI
jgi:hypothetical protein